MAKINDYKVKDEDFNELDIMSLPSRPSAAGMSAAQLQERFDAGSKQVIKPKLNALIDLLNGSEGAANIGVTPIDGVAGYFLQEVLIALKLLLDDKKSTEQADREIGLKFDTSEAQALVKDVSVNLNTGVIAITKYDGSVQTFDTAMEKVALDVRLDGQQFVLTLADGTEQRVDLSAFLTQTEVKNSDTITLSIESGAIVARLATGSVKLAHLNAEVTAYIDAKELAAYQSAQAAAVSEQNALNSANAAEASRQAALACQEQACLCATQAELSRQAAATSEQAAKKAQEEAEKAAGEAKAIAGGDFLETSVYDPNGKETDVFKYVDDAMTEKFGEEGKLPVQNGGLYINSDTTEEDKAEAKDGILALGITASDVGALKSDGFITTGTNIDELADGVYDYNGWADITGSVSKPFSNSRGVWIKKTEYNKVGVTTNRMDVAINCYTGAVYTMYSYDGTWHERYLPLDGGTLTGELTLSKRLSVTNFRVEDWNVGEAIFRIIDRTNANSNRHLVLFDHTKSANVAKALKMYDVVNGEYVGNYNIFGEHNKPSGSYTGNGSATSRMIEIGGIGNAVIVICTANSTALIITASGAFGKTGGSTGYFSYDTVHFTNGIITIASTDGSLNASGKNYTYQVL